MAYIGQNADGNFTTSVSKDTFSGNGSTTAFTLSEGATTNTVDVFVENIRQEPTTAYTVDGTTLTFTAAPVTGTNNIYVVNRGPIQLSASHPAAQALTAHSATITTDLTVDTNTLYVDSTNNRVGINDATPSEELDINGDGSDVRIRMYDGAGASVGRIAHSGANFDISNTATASATLTFTTGSGSGTERMRIDSSGNLLVGRTSASSATAGFTAQSDGAIYNAYAGRPYYVNRLSSDGKIIEFAKDGTTVASIDVASSDNVSFSATTGGGAGLLFFGANGTAPTILPMKENAVNDGETDLGRGANRFQDLFLSGSVYLGGTGSANALDDYEEGTFTPTYTGSSSNPTVTYDSQTSGSYVKIGRQVIAKIILRTDASSGGSGNLYISGLPFTASAASGSRAGTLNVGYSSSFVTENPQAGYISGGSTFVILSTNSDGDDSRSALNNALGTTNLATGTNGNFIMSTLIYEV